MGIREWFLRTWNSAGRRPENVGSTATTATASPPKPAVAPPPSLLTADESVRSTGKMKAQDAAEALRVLFDRALPAVPQLSDERVRHFHSDWDGGSGGHLHLKPTEQMRLLVAAHLRNLASQAGFEDFRIQADERWRCAFVEAFLATPRSVSFLLLWRKPGGELAAAATAAFPPSDDDAARAERWLAGLAQPAASTKAQTEADVKVKIAASAPTQLRLLDSFELTTRTDTLASVALSADASRLISLTLKGLVQIWDLVSRRELGAFDIDAATFYGYHYVDISADGNRGIAGGHHDVLIWDVAAKRPLHHLEVRGDVNSVRLSGDGRMALADAHDTLSLWDADTGDLIWQGSHSSYRPLQGGIAFAGPGIVAGSESGMSFFDTAKPTELESRARGLPTSIRCVAISPTGRQALSGGGDGDLVLWNLKTRLVAHTFPTSSGAISFGAISSVAFSADGMYALSAGKALCLWGCHSGKLLAKQAAEGGFFLGVAFSADGHSAAVIDMKGRVAVWSLEEHMKGEPVASVVDPPESVDTAVQLVDRVLKDARFETLEAAQVALATMDQDLLKDVKVRELVPALIERLGHEHWHVAASAAEVLARTGDTRAMDPLLRKALDADSLGTARIYLGALRGVDPSWTASIRGSEKVAVLVDKLKTASAHMLVEVDAFETSGRMEAVITVLGEIGDLRAVAPLIEILSCEDDRYNSARVAGAKGLALLGDATAVPVLTAAASRGFPSLKDAAQKALDVIYAKHG